MKRPMAIGLALLLVVSVAGMPLAAADAGTAAGVQEENQNSEDVEPGEQLTGVVGVQEAELDGELSERTYGIAISKAQTDDAKADVVEEQLHDVEDRVENLENRTEELNATYEAGEISQGQYEAEMATVAAEQKTTERLANGTAATAGELDEELLEERGIDVDSIQTLAERADELTGPEVAEIAQSIAGEQIGQSVDADRESGAPAEPPNAASDGPADDADEQGESEADADDRDESEVDDDESEADADDRDESEVDDDESDTAEEDETASDDDQNQNGAGNR